MPATLRFIQFFSLGTWVGSALFFSFVVAQGAFSILPNADMAGALVGYSLAKLHLIGVVLGVFYLLATIASARSIGALVSPAALLVIAMIICTVVSQHGVIARMDDLRTQMGSVAGTPATNAMRVAFDRLHQYSVWLESAVLLSGLTAMFLTARQNS
jgi:hypothetical protein